MKPLTIIYYSRIIYRKLKKLLKAAGFQKNYLSAKELIGVPDVAGGRTKYRDNISTEDNFKLSYYPALKNFIQNPDRLIQDKLKYSL